MNSVCLCECPWKSGKGIGSSGDGVLGSCELLTWCWKPNLGPQEEQNGSLMVEPSPLPQHFKLKKKKEIYFYLICEVICLHVYLCSSTMFNA